MQDDPALQELFRHEAEGIADRLGDLLETDSEAGLAEALRLAHTLKGLAVTTGETPLRDLARALEAALVAYAPGDAGVLRSAVDAVRGLVVGAPSSLSAARDAAARLRHPVRTRSALRVPWAREALLRRLLVRLPALLQVISARLEAGEERRGPRRAAVHELRHLAAGAGLLGQATVGGAGMALAAVLSRSNPSPEDAHPLLEALRSASSAVDLPTTVLPGSGYRDTRHLQIPVQLPWPDVDDPTSLMRALERVAGGGTIVAARPAPSDSRSLCGVLEVTPSRRSASGGEGFVRVSHRHLDRMLQLSEKLVAAKARARRLASSSRKLAAEAPPGARLGLRRHAREASEHDRDLDLLARATQEAVLRSRLVTVRGLFGLARMTAREHLTRHPTKSVDVRCEGVQTEVDKGSLDALVDPILQLVKNALTHGIEPRTERAEAGKPERALLRLSVDANAVGVTFTVSDNGRGLAPQIAHDPFAAGVSSAEQVSDDAGRGLGLASVRERVRALRGRLTLQSAPGAGTTLTIVIPPVVATARILLVRVGPELYALPLASVRSIEEASAVDPSLPQVRLQDLVGRPAGEERRRGARRRSTRSGRDRRMKDAFAILLVGEGDGLLACLVDDVLRRDLVVVRPLGGRFSPPGVEGAALFGDGRLVLVLDVHRLTPRAPAAEGIS